MTKTVRAIGIERFELERLRDQVGRLFATLQEAADADLPPSPGEWCPPFDVCETSTEVLITVELPGVEAESIELHLTNVQLRICGQKKKMPRNKVRSHLCSERAYGNFDRAVTLRWSINVSECTATLMNGLLTVRLPRLLDRRGEAYKIPVTLG
jgi:HSP20 family protein